jgi:type II secretory pathway component PulK
MGLAQRLKSIQRHLDQSGIALFIVLSSVSVLSILVTEFVYIANISQQIAYGGLDQTKAHYLAKSGLKLSLLRLKAYQQVKTYVKTMTQSAGPGAEAMVPHGLLDRIWSFPFFYPIPTNIPGIGGTEKDAIEKFQKESSMDGSFSAIIESESSKYNLNLLLPHFAPSPIPTNTAVPPPQPTPGATPGAFNAEQAQQSLQEYLGTLMAQKMETDQDFAAIYRDLRLDDLVLNIRAWVDRAINRQATARDKIPMKRAPFYNLSELHMVPLMDDELYELFSPNLTASTTDGININTINNDTLRALLPQMTKIEAQEFFKFRDSQETDNRFRNPDTFYKYISKNVAALGGGEQVIADLKAAFAKRNIRIVTEETQFKITVKANVNSATRTIIAWVTLGAPAGGTNNPPGGPSTPPGGANNPPGGTLNPPGGPNNPPGGTLNPNQNQNLTGLKITYMKVF